MLQKLCIVIVILIITTIGRIARTEVACEVGDNSKGKWVSLGPICKIPGAEAEYIRLNGVNYWQATAISGRYKQMENQGAIYGERSHTGFGCSNEFSGGPDTYYQCVPCPPYDFDSGLRYTMDKRAPGAYAQYGEIIHAYPCLAPGFPAGVEPKMVTELRHSGRVWEWVGNGGINSWYPCSKYVSSIGDYYYKFYVGNPTGVIEAWEWICDACVGSACETVREQNQGPSCD